MKAPQFNVVDICRFVIQRSPVWLLLTGVFGFCAVVWWAIIKLVL